MPRLQANSFTNPDDAQTTPNVRFDTVNLDETTVGYCHFEPGWRWTTEFGSQLGLASCPIRHLGYSISGSACSTTSTRHRSGRSTIAGPSRWKETLMKIVVTSVLVDDQEKALRFYADVLGFEKKDDVPVGDARWLTVVSPQDPDGIELLLEPDSHPAAKPFKQALVEDGIPYTSFGVDDVQAEYERLSGRGVRFTQPPTGMGQVTTAVFDDTCGNLIQIAQRA
jgi:catechol 2,3-dioxygenase-like lactoylglutathione lyase family enzyme